MKPNSSKLHSLRQPLIWLLLSVLGLASGGCVSKQAHEATAAALASCEDEKTQSQAAVIAWETRFDRESQRWDEMEGSINEALPQALTEFHGERDRILELVPEQVQFEVSSYLEDYFSTVMKGFEALKNDNDAIRLQLAENRKTLSAVGADTRSISAETQQIKEIRSTLDEALASEQAKRQELSQRLAEIVTQVSTFDEKKIHCKSCEGRLKLNRKEREALSAFHAQLTRALSEARTLAGE